MLIQSVDSCGCLYSVTEVFPSNIVSQITSCSWDTQPYQQLEIGRNKRRRICDAELPFDSDVNDYALRTLRPQIEQACGVKFIDDEYWSLSWWMDEPGFRPDMHCDGTLPSAMQIYLLPNNDTTLGTTFFNTKSDSDVMHRFPSVTNTGYMMFNAHTCDGVKKLLWHDMERQVPESVQRICCYITLGNYTKL
jgi:hypothetical protein